MTGPTQRTLVVMRHSKAEPAAASDFERELSARGRSDAAATGRWLRDRGFSPDAALVSAATRTQQTWAAVARSAGWTLCPDLDSGLYAAGPDTTLDLLRTIPDEWRAVLVIGHNPTVASLAQLLDDGEGDMQAGTAMALGFPTSAAAVFAYTGPWAALGAGSARVAAFHVAGS